MVKKILFVGLGLLTSSCLDQTSIQRDYISERSGCQSEAESRISEYQGELAGADARATNAKLVSLFSDCMSERGWSVASPTRDKPTEENPLEAARKTQAQAAQPNTQPAAAPAPQPAPVYAPAAAQQPAPVYYQQVPAPAPIYPQQQVAPNTPMQAPVYYQQVPAPQPIYPQQQVAPVYYQQVPAPTYAPQPAPIYLQQAPNPAPQAAPTYTAPIYQTVPDNAPDAPAEQPPAPVRQ